MLGAAAPTFRPGTTQPAASPGLPAAPLARLAHDHRESPSRLRRSLRYAFIEGMVAELVGAFAGGAVLTGWALHLGCRVVETGIIVSLPQLAQLVQVPAAFVTRRLGARRTCIVAVGLSRQLYLPLAALPFLPVTPAMKQTCLLLVAGAQAVLGVLGNNAWVAWMGDLVPRRLVGRYFGLRTAYATGAGALAAGLAGRWLDDARGGTAVGHTLAAMAVGAALLGAVTILLLSRQHDPSGPIRDERLCWQRAFTPYRNPSLRPLLLYQGLWNAAVGLAASYFAFHMLTNLSMGFFLVAVHGTATAAARMLSSPFMGRAIDRLGARRVLVMSSLFIALLPALWLGITKDRLWPLVLDALLSGIFWGGHALAMLALPLRLAPRPDRPFVIAALGTVGGAAFALATFVAGRLVNALSDTLVVADTQFLDVHVIMLASCLARLAASVAALRIQDRSLLRNASDHHGFGQERGIQREAEAGLSRDREATVP